jgi:hypothetical protein
VKERKRKWFLLARKDWESKSFYLSFFFLSLTSADKNKTLPLVKTPSNYLGYYSVTENHTPEKPYDGKSGAWFSVLWWNGGLFPQD